MNKYTPYIIIALILFGIAIRLSPHLPNATPITALTFTSSMFLSKRWAFLIPLGALALSDMIIGFYDWRIMMSVYGSFACIGFFSFITKKYSDIPTVLATVTGSAVFFFLVTNASVWAFSPWYEKNISGLLYAYELGLPFLRNMLIGDLIYTLTLVSIFKFVFSQKTVALRGIGYPYFSAEKSDSPTSRRHAPVFDSASQASRMIQKTPR